MKGVSSRSRDAQLRRRDRRQATTTVVLRYGLYAVPVGLVLVLAWRNGYGLAAAIVAAICLLGGALLNVMMPQNRYTDQQRARGLCIVLAIAELLVLGVFVGGLVTQAVGSPLSFGLWMTYTFGALTTTGIGWWLSDIVTLPRETATFPR